MSSKDRMIPLNSSFDSKRSRIHFPAEPPAAASLSAQSQPVYFPQDFPQESSGSKFKTSLSPSGLPSGSSKLASSTARRRRVQSVDTTDVFTESPHPQRKLVHGFLTPPRGMKSLPSRTFKTVQEDSLNVDQFSDEYDLTNDDPKILQEVQRALKFKARREARLGNKLPTETLDRLPLGHSQRQSISAQPDNPTSSTDQVGVSVDLDFGPSVGPMPPHPVPASLDNGETLDWSGFNHRSEGRWHLSGSKRKGKETLQPSTLVMDHQETVYSDKIARLKAIVTPDTSRKAKVTGEQLGRRYKLLYASLSDGTFLNLIEVARWHSAQGALVKGSLDKAEPFIWLNHLDKRTANHPARSPWHLSALIVEEYTQARTRSNPTGMVPEAFITPSVSSPTASHNLPNRALPQFAGAASAEGDIPPRPIFEVTGASLESGSRKSTESSFSSLPIVAPSSIHGFRAQGRVLRPRKKSMDNNNDNSSLSDHSDGRLAVLSSPEPNNNVAIASDQSENDNLAKPAITLHVTAPSLPSTSEANLFIARSPTQRSRTTIDSVLGRRRAAHTSIQRPNRLSTPTEIRFRREVNEEQAYELKAKLLDEVAANNHRIRQLLNRVSNTVREYDTTQANAMNLLGITHTGIPQELLDAFGHDPAAVTSATRKFKGWRAVDDINNRLLRQREVFEEFLAQSESEPSLPQSVLDNPMASLSVCLDALERHQQQITRQATRVLETLKAVQTMHAGVKEEYKVTLSRTSVVYPELSYIVALEESYKDQYQQFWEFGMDTLTFILDTVAPFWRTYGKTIGHDMQDFLIIPLYRNEFTGEPKRYPVRGVPARSLRHWLGLVLFFFLSVSINVLQIRAALSSSAHYTLHMIPYESIRWTALPFFWIGIVIQWWAVIVELFVVVLQIGILTWWFGWSIGLFT